MATFDRRIVAEPLPTMLVPTTAAELKTFRETLAERLLRLAVPD